MTATIPEMSLPEWLVLTILSQQSAHGFAVAQLTAADGDLGRALPLYRALHPLLRWDSKTEFVQAIKLSMDLLGGYGGPCRHPRMPLADEQDKTIRIATENAAHLESDA